MLTLTDLFCGAGGSALGAHAVESIDLRLAANHWQLAVDTHASNFPDADHMVADISQVNPRRVPKTDLLWASPECTNHSQAKGVKRQIGPDLFGETLPDEASERSRATMWDVPRFAERHGYKAIVVENVVDAAKWLLFPAWLAAMKALGYEHQLVSLNSMHAEAAKAPRAPQSRDRLYVVFHRIGDTAPKVKPRPLAWCDACDKQVRAVQVWKPGRHVGRYRQQYTYACKRNHTVEPYALAASTAIDWALLGQRIGDRDRLLAPKTMARIVAGLERYAGELIVPSGGTWNDTASSVHHPMRTRTTRETDALVVPVEGRDGKVASLTSRPFRTQSTRAETALVVPYYRTGVAHPVTHPLPTQATVDTAGIAFIAELRGGGSKHRSVREPLATVTASGNHHMLVRQNTPRGNPAQMCTPTTEPARTITTTGHQSLVGWGGPRPDVEDCTFRMLEPSEIQAAMAFHEDYGVLGTRRERVRQLGNAVTPPAAEFLLRAVSDALS